MGRQITHWILRLSKFPGSSSPFGFPTPWRSCLRNALRSFISLWSKWKIIIPAPVLYQGKVDGHIGVSTSDANTRRCTLHPGIKMDNFTIPSRPGDVPDHEAHGYEQDLGQQGTALNQFPINPTPPLLGILLALPLEFWFLFLLLKQTPHIIQKSVALVAHSWPLSREIPDRAYNPANNYFLITSQVADRFLAFVEPDILPCISLHVPGSRQ